jgi:hypothetical protein
VEVGVGVSMSLVGRKLIIGWEGYFLLGDDFVG